MDDSSVVGVLAEALAQHDGGFLRKDGDWQCFCGAVEVVSTFPGALARHQASVVVALPNIAIAVGDPFDATPEQMRCAAAVVAGSFETGDWDRPRTARKLLDIAAARAAGGQE